ncbi:MAG: beta-galactosidase trimerization domain-containing protein [Armatimonadetes bacterium]|nr:beta-galactosidase trimerization domain-containing protein [Armatimonadota bacterium]
MKPIGRRDIHLDFHTHGDIPGIGADFDPDEFTLTLTNAHVDSICVFARCHHGYCYYPTTVGTPHPHLARPDLLGDMVTALHGAGIKVGIYTTVVWDELTWQNHPAWRVVKPDGRFVDDGSAGWKWLCMNTAYADWLEEHTREILERYRCDRVFFDIVMPWPDGCCCDDCLAGMKVEGLDAGSAADRRTYGERVRSRFVERFAGIVADHDPTLPAFFNRSWTLTSHPEMTARRDWESYGQMVVESLPSGGWGYNHFPLLAGYFAWRGKDMNACTGRFLRSWGDFGGLKNPVALEYECVRTVAWGVKCDIGDQLHPRGRLEKATYDLVGGAYGLVEQLEPWCLDTEPLAEVGIVVGTGTGPDGLFDGDNRSEEGAMRTCLELQVPFLIVDTADDFDRFRVLLLPDKVMVDDALAKKLARFLAAGGQLIASHRSGLRPDGQAFAPPQWPAVWHGEGEHTTHYLRPLPAAGPDLAEFDYAVYERGGQIVAEDEATTLALSVPPYFERRPQHFCSHAQAPSTGVPSGPAAVRRGAVTHFADPLFRLYKETGHGVYRTLVRNALRVHDPRPLLRTNLPSTAEVTLRRRGEAVLVHILHYVPQRRAGIDIVEDVIPLHGVELCVRMDREVKGAKLVPEGEAIALEMVDGYACVRVPVVSGHAHVVVE